MLPTLTHDLGTHFQALRCAQNAHSQHAMAPAPAVKITHLLERVKIATVDRKVAGGFAVF